MNRYVIDTHIFLWLIFDPKKVSRNNLTILENPKNDVFLCSSSLWEISIKFGLNKLKLNGLLPSELPNLMKNMAIQPLDVSHLVMATLFQLPSVDKHKDPFDRLMIWQCIQADYVLLSQDGKFDAYQAFGLKLI
ncbi:MULTISPECIES: type II toxin-antitoxin system VapC family toxin [unclassified Moraxella]|uniref:type II toxin-antitoxin system VapC family toxin n=1 Tax=unclassified Moraxella TaxID=2685852 RepID=UPI003AF9F8F5